MKPGIEVQGLYASFIGLRGARLKSPGSGTMARAYFQAHEIARFGELDGLPLAGFAQRAIGFAVDLLVVASLRIPIDLLWARFSSGQQLGESGIFSSLSSHGWRSLLLAMLYFPIVNYLSNGRSLGKWITGTRVVSLMHERLRLWQCVERVAGYGVSLAEGIGFLQFFWSPNRMCVHDRIAETIVVDVRASALRLAGIDDGEDQLIELVEGL
jgi:uncharacterized RDD family membrane protein YckC